MTPQQLQDAQCYPLAMDEESPGDNPRAQGHPPGRTIAAKSDSGRIAQSPCSNSYVFSSAHWLHCIRSARDHPGQHVAWLVVMSDYLAIRNGTPLQISDTGFYVIMIIATFPCSCFVYAAQVLRLPLFPGSLPGPAKSGPN